MPKRKFKPLVKSTMYMNGLKPAATYNGIEKLLAYVIMKTISTAIAYRKSNDVRGVKYPL